MTCSTVEVTVSETEGAISMNWRSWGGNSTYQIVVNLYMSDFHELDIFAYLKHAIRKHYGHCTTQYIQILFIRLIFAICSSHLIDGLCFSAEKVALDSQHGKNNGWRAVQSALRHFCDKEVLPNSRLKCTLSTVKSSETIKNDMGVLW